MSGATAHELQAAAWDGTTPLPLGEGWALGADDLQWMVLRKFVRKSEAQDWRAVSFVATTKDILRRVLREKGCQLSAEGQAALDALPETFKEWRAAVHG